MPEEQVLNLARDFPPVPTADWEVAIRKDLKGADYEKKLVWRTDEGLAIRPYYRRENLAGREPVRPDFKHWEPSESIDSPPNGVRADLLHEAGGHAVQELAFALAEAVERIEPEFVFAVGSNYFFEIAKLRAARLLWARAAAALGVDPTAKIHVRTSRRNKSVHDPYTNLLRVTSESCGKSRTSTLSPIPRQAPTTSKASPTPSPAPAGSSFRKPNGWAATLKPADSSKRVS